MPGQAKGMGHKEGRGERCVRTHTDRQTQKATYRSALRTASARRFSCSFLSLETLRSKSIGVVVVWCVRRSGWGVYFELENGEACVWGVQTETKLKKRGAG